MGEIGRHFQYISAKTRRRGRNPRLIHAPGATDQIIQFSTNGASATSVGGYDLARDWSCPT
jgi:hypothetical protein